MSLSELTSLLRSLENVRDNALSMIATVKQQIAKQTPPSFRQQSVHFNSALSKKERHDQGIYFTPFRIRDRLFEILDRHGVKPTRILEPTAGTGEFAIDARARYPRAHITCVEKNDKLCKSIPAAATDETHCVDFLHFRDPSKYDLVIGNPPYFVVKDKNPECMTGRGNIFVQILYKCLTQDMAPNGVLAFVLPTSFYNCSYYAPCRKYMAAHTTILHVETMSGDFYDTAQETTLLVVKLAPPPSPEAPYWFRFGDGCYLTPQYAELKELVKSATTLDRLGLCVKTGDVVWNQHKTDLHDTEGTLVLYSANIRNRELVFEPLGGEKKQRIRNFLKPPVRGPAIVVSRGYGNSYSFEYALVPQGSVFYGENHVNVITPCSASSETVLPRILASFADPRTKQFISMFIGNGAISKSELERVLPIF